MRQSKVCLEGNHNMHRPKSRHTDRPRRFRSSSRPKRPTDAPAAKPSAVLHADRPKAETRTTEPGLVFASLDDAIQKAIADKGYQNPTPIQAQAIAPLLEGHDLVACSQTGTGKTAAFVLPLLQTILSENVKPTSLHPKALILAPTRELAQQIDQSIQQYGKYLSIKHTVIYGGVRQHRQVSALKQGVDILVATPGRLVDLMNQGYVKLGSISFLVLDEADRMLDMGFLPDIRRILKPIPQSRQSILFSATYPPAVRELVQQITHKPQHVSIAPKQPAVERIRQHVVFVESGRKAELLSQLLSDTAVERAIVFTKMKHAANRIARNLDRQGISAAAIHGNKSQSAREKSLNNFRTGATRVLVATDIAARGLDIKSVTHVINYDLPTEAENYIHRIGRTARAGADGEAVSFCSSKERSQLQDIEKLLKTPLSELPKNRRQLSKTVSESPASAPTHSPTPKGQRRSPSSPKSAGSRRRRFRGKPQGRRTAKNSGNKRTFAA